MLLKNKTAVITGCNRGIGKKILEVFFENGANINACVRNKDKEFVNYINQLNKKKENKIEIFQLDLSLEDNIKDVAKKILLSNSKIDILVNNAGILQSSLFQMTAINKLKEIFEINFFSQFLFTQFILKSMMKNKNGSIINISSTSGIDADAGRSSYSATKAALIAKSKSLSKEIGKFNIRSNSIAPGLTDTEMMTQNTSQEMIEFVLKNVALNRIATTKEIANVALFLASDLSSYITGQTIRVDGGM